MMEELGRWNEMPKGIIPGGTASKCHRDISFLRRSPNADDSAGSRARATALSSCAVARRPQRRCRAEAKGRTRSEARRNIG